MTKPKTRTISGPFDARHVGGVSVPGATIPIIGVERSSTTGLEPDETPSHTFVATGNIEVPRRSNTIAHSLSRPSLRLKTSISLLRGRSSSNSPDTYRKKETPDLHDASRQNDMQPMSLRNKSSSTRLWQRVHHDAQIKEAPPKQEEPEKPLEEEVTPDPVEKDPPVINLKPPVGNLSLFPPIDPSAYRAPPPLPPRDLAPTLQSVPLQKKLPPVRPKRADSGTAIDFDDVPVEERPLGFKEILAVSSFAERMALYKKTREYWAKADHGLDEWVGRAGTHRPIVFQV